jgi:hypothetical protein
MAPGTWDQNRVTIDGGRVETGDPESRGGESKTGQHFLSVYSSNEVENRCFAYQVILATQIKRG